VAPETKDQGGEILDQNKIFLELGETAAHSGGKKEIRGVGGVKTGKRNNRNEKRAGGTESENKSAWIKFRSGGGGKLGQRRSSSRQLKNSQEKQEISEGYRTDGLERRGAG